MPDVASLNQSGDGCRYAPPSIFLNFYIEILGLLEFRIWNLEFEKSRLSAGFLQVSQEGFEPSTNGLKGRCSTN